MSIDNIDFSRFEYDYTPREEKTHHKKSGKKAAPKITAKTRAEIREVKKNKNQVKKEMRKNEVRAVSLIILCVVFFAPIFLFIGARSQLNALGHTIENTKKLISYEQSEKIRLENEINTLMTLNKIEYYAENILGMVKQGSYNVEFCDFSGENRVLLSGGKSYDDTSNSFFNRLLSLFD